MTQLGSPEQWVDFLESQVPTIVGLVIAAWEAMPAPAGNELEDTVSEALCTRLRQSRTGRDLPFQIHTQLVEADPAAGQEQGRLDIVFMPLVNREDIYFCLECKRLHVREAGVARPRPYYAEYVQYGMFRFVRGQYAQRVRFGGMLAFVLDGDVPGAMTGVEGNIRVNHRDLGMAPPGDFRPSGARSADTRVRETEHRRGANPTAFVIQHLFMAGDPNAALRTPPPSTAAKPKKKAAKTKKKTGSKPRGKPATKRKR